MNITPGWQTTEFYTTLLGYVVGILALFGVQVHDDVVKAVAVLVSMLVGAVYAHGRTQVKVAQMETAATPPQDSAT